MKTQLWFWIREDQKTQISPLTPIIIVSTGTKLTPPVVTMVKLVLVDTADTIAHGGDK